MHGLSFSPSRVFVSLRFSLVARGFSGVRCNFQSRLRWFRFVVCVCVSIPVPKEHDHNALLSNSSFAFSCTIGRGLWVHFHARANEDRESMDVQRYLQWCISALCMTQLTATHLF